MNECQPAKIPTFYFIGVTTAKSSIMKVFPKWAKALNLGEVEMKGIDLPLHADPNIYREVVLFLKNDPLSLGALVTTHKLDLFDACKDMFDYIDPFAATLKEVSSLSKKDGKFCAHAKDPISSGLALEAFIPENFWKSHNGEVLLLGAGGSSLAMSLYFTQKKFAGNIPSKIIIANRSTQRLIDAEKSLTGAGNFSYVHGPNPTDNDFLVSQLPSYSLIVNATGLGKDAPGSPLTDAALFPENSYVWEINYRGDLLFMRQAQNQASQKNLHIEDGWTYFIHGWLQVIQEVFHISIDKNRIDELSRIARTC